MPIDANVTRSDMVIGNDSTWGKSRPKLTLDAVVKKDMMGLNSSDHLALDRAYLHKMIHVAEPNWLG